MQSNIYKKIFIILVLVSTSTLFANKIINISTLSDYPPFTFVEKGLITPPYEIIPPNTDSKFLKGYSWDIVRESFHILGYTIKLTIVPWARCVKYIENQKTDLIFPAIKNNQRQTDFYFSKQPVDKQNLIIYLKNNSNLKFNGLKSLNNLKIGTMKGWSFGEEFDNANYILKEKSYTILSGLKKLIKGNLDGVAGYEISYDYILKQNKIYEKVKKTVLFHSTFEYLISYKKNKHSKYFLNEYDTGKELIIKNGIFDNISRKWFKNDKQ